MKRILFLSLAMGFYSSVNAQFFTQDFSSSTTVDDYVNVVPSQGRFNVITPTVAKGTNGSMETSITSGNLRFVRPNPVDEGVTNCAAINVYRDFGLTTALKFVQLKFDFELSGTHALTANSVAGGQSINIQIGSGFTTASSVYATRIGIYPTANQGEFKVTNITPSPAINSSAFSGKQTIVVIVNNTTSDQTYTAPDLTTESIAAGTMEFWVGISKFANDNPIINPTNTIDGFKISAASSHKFFGTFDFDNIQMTDFLGGANLSTSKFDASSVTISNPVKNELIINGLSSSIEAVSVYNMVGGLVLESKVDSTTSVNLNVASLSKGVYIVKMTGKNGSFSKKIIKE